MPPCCGDDILLALHFVAHRRRLPAGRQTVLPKLVAIPDVIGSDEIVRRGGQERNASGGGKWSAQAWHAHFDRNRNRRAIPDSSVPTHPYNLHRLEVDAGHEAPGWPLAGQADRGKERMEDYTIWRAVHRLHAYFAASRMRVVWSRRIVGATRQELRDERDRDRVGNRDLPDRVDGNATPLEHAEVAWENKRALQ